MTLLQNTPRGETKAVAEGTGPAELHCRAHKQAGRQAFALAAPRISPENCSVLTTPLLFFVSPEFYSTPHRWALVSLLGDFPWPERSQDGVHDSSAQKQVEKSHLPSCFKQARMLKKARCSTGGGNLASKGCQEHCILEHNFLLFRNNTLETNKGAVLVLPMCRGEQVELPRLSARKCSGFSKSDQRAFVFLLKSCPFGLTGGYCISGDVLTHVSMQIIREQKLLGCHNPSSQTLSITSKWVIRLIVLFPDYT